MAQNDSSCTPTVVPLPRPNGKPLYHGTDYGRAYTGILTAGFLYAAVLPFVLAAIDLLVGGSRGLSFSDTLTEFVGTIWIFLMAFSMALTMVFLPLALFCLCGVIVIARSMTSTPSWAVVGGAAGGVSGYLATVWMLFAPDARPSGSYLLAVLLGPLLASVVGQAGGCWNALAPQWLGGEGYNSHSSFQPWQFDIRQAMKATAWVAGILALLKLLGALGVGSGSVLIGGMVLQAITLPLVIRVVRQVREGPA